MGSGNPAVITVSNNHEIESLKKIERKNIRKPASEKVLILASVASMIDQFNIPNIKLLLDMGYEVHVACNFVEGNTCSKERINKLKNILSELNVQYYQVDFKRSIKLFANIKAYKQVCDLMKNHKYKFVHCHSPIGGMCGRLAGKKTKTKVIYTAHGFHFFKGAPVRNWLIYPIEKLLSRFTDILITINKEDYERARTKFKAKQVVYIPGVGIEVNKFKDVKVDRTAKLKELGIDDDSFVILSVGELTKRKNHEVIIKAIAMLKNPKIHYVICGQGPLQEYLKNLALRLNIGNQVHLLGYREDISEICKSCDLFAFPSLREGLGIAALEAMASGLPLVTSNVQGIVDYAVDGETGFVCNPKDIKGFSKCIERLITDNILLKSTSLRNIQAVNRFDIQNTLAIMQEVYDIS